jgi:hypothetical protein
LKTLEGPLWIIIGLAICLYSYKMGLGSFNEPGAGFVAFLTGLFLMIMGTSIFIQRKRVIQGVPKDERTEICNSEESFVESTVFKLVYIVALLLIYALLLNYLGYILTTFLVMFGLFLGPVRRRFAFAFTASLISAGITYIVFEVWLHSQLPRGIFPWW